MNSMKEKQPDDRSMISKALFRLLFLLSGKAIPYKLLQVFKVFRIGFYSNTPLKILTFTVYQNTLACTKTNLNHMLSRLKPALMLFRTTLLSIIRDAMLIMRARKCAIN